MYKLSNDYVRKMLPTIQKYRVDNKALPIPTFDKNQHNPIHEGIGISLILLSQIFLFYGKKFLLNIELFCQITE
jgi:hypothetical protein